MRERRVNRQAYTKPYTTSSQTRGVPSVSSPMVVQGCSSTVWLAMEAGSCGAGEGMCTKDGRKQHDQSKRPNTKCASGGATALPPVVVAAWHEVTEHAIPGCINGNRAAVLRPSWYAHGTKRSVCLFRRSAVAQGRITRGEQAHRTPQPRIRSLVVLSMLWTHGACFDWSDVVGFFFLLSLVGFFFLVSSVGCGWMVGCGRMWSDADVSEVRSCERPAWFFFFPVAKVQHPSILVEH